MKRMMDERPPQNIGLILIKIQLESVRPSSNLLYALRVFFVYPISF
jgi:hypothetical protein